ncbi:MAG: CHASE2 domain-containing protein, partial [Candidatus Cloacimonadota bacterium]|nr:CHASE2 domain-containing protein [Candidatus Cloacimonadota bacterium]
MKSFFGKIVSPLIIFVIVELFFLTSTWENVERKALNQLFEIRGSIQTYDDILLVTIDDDTFSALDTNWPFPRDYYARVINNLEKAGAKLIVFDVLFTESTNEKADSILAHTATQYNNIVFAGKLNKQSGNMFESSQIIKPIPSILQHDVPWGLVNITYDKDSFVRNYNLYQKHDDENFFSLGIVALSHLNQKNTLGWKSKIKLEPKRMKINNYEIPMQSKNSLLINFYGPKATFNSVSFGNVIDDAEFEMATFDIDAFEEEMATGKFKDKIILIGSTAEELHDNFATPFFSNGQLTSGVEIHANFLEMVLHDDYLYKIHYLYVVLAHLLLLIIIFIINSYLKPNVSFLINLSLIILSIIGSF